MKKRTGFTLIELMIVVVIIGILLVLVLPRIIRLMDKSREKTTHKNLKNIKLAIDMYCEQSDGGYNYPKTRDELKKILEKKFGEENIPRAVLRLGSGVPASNECYVTDSVANIPVGEEGGWVFMSAGSNTGSVYINSKKEDTLGNPYTTYSCW